MREMFGKGGRAWASVYIVCIYSLEIAVNCMYKSKNVAVYGFIKVIRVVCVVL